MTVWFQEVYEWDLENDGHKQAHKPARQPTYFYYEGVRHSSLGLKSMHQK